MASQLSHLLLCLIWKHFKAMFSQFILFFSLCVICVYMCVSAYSTGLLLWRPEIDFIYFSLLTLILFIYLETGSFPCAYSLMFLHLLLGWLPERLRDLFLPSDKLRVLGCVPPVADFIHNSWESKLMVSDFHIIFPSPAVWLHSSDTLWHCFIWPDEISGFPMRILSWVENIFKTSG